MMSTIKETTRELKDYSTKTLKGLKKVRITVVCYSCTDDIMRGSLSCV